MRCIVLWLYFAWHICACCRRQLHCPCTKTLSANVLHEPCVLVARLCLHAWCLSCKVWLLCYFCCHLSQPTLSATHPTLFCLLLAIWQAGTFLAYCSLPSLSGKVQSCKRRPLVCGWPLAGCKCHIYKRQTQAQVFCQAWPGAVRLLGTIFGRLVLSFTGGQQPSSVMRA